MISRVLILLLAAFLLGSVPSGVILTCLFSKVDVREAGSGNIGAYNVYRVGGTKLGIMTLIADMLKGALPVLVAVCWVGMSDWRGELWVCIVALSAFAGHLFSVFLGFKGGKGVATAAGCFLVMAPLVLLICASVYVLILCISGYSSAGSLSATAILPGTVYMATHSVPITGCAVIMAVLIFCRHKDNIRRLLDGTEHSSLKR
jgi:glycerol-3-phosphate acyltransferase PlsY